MAESKNTYTNVYHDENGERHTYIGRYIPLYITLDQLNMEVERYVERTDDVFIPKIKCKNGKYEAGTRTNYSEGYTRDFTSILIRGGPITVEDKLHILSISKLGRQILSQYVEPSAAFSTDDRLEPLRVKQYYVLSGGPADEEAMDSFVRFHT